MNANLRKGKIMAISSQDDRIVLYLDKDYHVIQSPKSEDVVNVGDEIVYEPQGVNFGWFKSVIRIKPLAKRD